MSMSTHVIGFAPPDDKWKAMKAIWDSCEAAGVPIPKEVERFFGGERPDESGVEVDVPVREWGDDSREGYEIDVAAIPAHVKSIRFYNSW